MNFIRQILRKTILTIVMAGCSTCSLLFAAESAPTAEKISVSKGCEFVCYEDDNSVRLRNIQSWPHPYLIFNITNNLISTISRYHFIANVFDFNGKFLITLNNVCSATLDPSARFILTGSKDGKISICNLNDGNCLLSLSLLDTQESSAPEKEYKKYIFSATFNRSGSLIAASANNIAKVWNLSGKQVCALLGHSDPILSTEFNPAVIAK